MALTDTAKEWMNEPNWNKVFKNTYDVFEEQIHKCLVAVAALAVAIRIGANLQTGDLVCIVVASTSKHLSLKELAGPFHASLANYAGQDEFCRQEVFEDSTSDFLMFSSYGPFILMIQALMLIFMERLTVLLPRLNQRLERFYKSVVEETLIGKDPDVAEDFAGADLSVEKILRIRQREEICGAFKSSSSFYWCYFWKNFAQIVATIIFLSVDIAYIMNAVDVVGFCDIPFGKESADYVTMQCRQKRFSIIRSLVIAFAIFLLITIVLNLMALIWLWEGSRLRKITNILKSLKNKEEGELVRSDGQDFLFMFDMLAHNCGVPATLRVLTYTAPRFTEFCRPELDLKNLKMTESSLLITWQPPQLQSIDAELKRHLNLQKYVVTILPKIKENYKNIPTGGNYIAEFNDLAGGTKEYIVTVSAIISDAKMKGATYRTYLPPYPPQRLQVEQDLVADDAGSHLKVSWIKPKGDFDKYLLTVCSLNGVPSDQMEIQIQKDRDEFSIQNLSPGEAYRIVLKTYTGFQACQQHLCPELTSLTQPLPPSEESIKVQINADHVDAYWQSPDRRVGHTLLEAYEIELRNAAGSEIAKNLLKNNTFRYTFTDLSPGQEYMVALASVCRLRDKDNRILKNSISSQAVKRFMTLPGPPINLVLDKSEPSSLKFSWDAPGIDIAGVTYAVSIEMVSDGEGRYQSEKKFESTSAKLSGLPVSGGIYEVQVKTLFIYAGEPLYSSPLVGRFVTKPYPPSDLQVVDNSLQSFQWTKSVSKSVNQYKFKIKGAERTQDFIVTDQAGQPTILFNLDLSLEAEVEYNINIYSQSFINDVWHESNSLYVKLVKEFVDSSYSSAVNGDELDGLPDKIARLTLTSSKAVHDPVVSDRVASNPTRSKGSIRRGSVKRV